MGDFGAPFAWEGQALFTTLIALVCTISILKKSKFWTHLICQEGTVGTAPKAHGHGHSQSMREVYAPNLSDGTIAVTL
jgi:hypothetical protein